ncbi:MAG: hypothetical protein WKG07_01495 [Hymenobacter sp.]
MKILPQNCLLSFSRPYADFVPLYLRLHATLGIILGIANFTLIIPLLNVLFGTADTHAAAAPTVLPAFAFTLDYVKLVFDYYAHRMLAQHGKLGTLAFVCGLVVVSVFLEQSLSLPEGGLLAGVRARVVQQRARNVVYQRVTELAAGLLHR